LARTTRDRPFLDYLNCVGVSGFGYTKSALVIEQNGVEWNEDGSLANC